MDLSMWDEMPSGPDAILVGSWEIREIIYIVRSWNDLFSLCAKSLVISIATI